jgi:hypothetical protein
MATAQDLDRLRALLAKMQQVGSAATGELIRAADWNTLAGSIADLAQVVLAADTAAAVPPHQHLDQVDLDWFTATVRDLIQRGGLSDPATQNRLALLEQALQRLAARVDATSSTIDSYRGRLTDLATSDLARQTALTTVQRAVNNVVDPRPDIAAMRASLDSVQASIATVQQTAANLTVGGAPIDFGALVGRVSNLETFRDQFRSADGALLDASTIEHRLATIEATAVTQDQLNQILADRPLTVPPEVVNGLETRLGATLRDQVTAQLGAFQTQVQGNLDTRLAGVSELVASRLADAVPSIAATVTANVNQSVAAAQKAAIDTAGANAQAAIAAREQAIRNDLAAGLASVNDSIAAAVGTQVAQQVAVALQPVRASLNANSQKIDALSTQVAQHEVTLQQHSATLAQFPLTLAATKSDLAQQLQNEIALQVAAINRSIDDRFTSFQKQQNDLLSAALQNITTKVTDAATLAATNAANNAANAVRAQIVADMQTVARDQANAIVAGQLRTAVNQAVSDRLASLPNLVATEVQRVRPTG